MELDKLERLESKLYRAADATFDNEEICRLSAQIVRISESRRKLLGLDAPQKIEHSGPLFTVSEASPLTKAWPDATNEARCTKIKFHSKKGARRSLRHSTISHRMRAYRCDRCGLYRLTKEGRQFDERQRSDYDAGPE